MIARIIERGRNINLPLFLLSLIVVYGTVIIVPNGIEVRDQRIVNFCFILFLAAGVFITAKINIPMGVLTLWACILAMMEMYKHQGFFFLLFAFVAFYICISLSYKSWMYRKDTVYDCLVFTVLMNVLFQVLQYFRIYWLTYPLDLDLNMLTGLMSNCNETSALYAMCFPAFLRKSRYHLLPFLALGLVMASSTNGVLAVFIVGMVVLFRTFNLKRYWKRVVVGAMALMALFASYLIAVDKFNYQAHKDARLFIWGLTAKVAFVKPFGWGWYQYERVIPLLTNFKYLPVDLRQAYYGEVRDKKGFDIVLNMVSRGDISYFFGDKQMTMIYAEAHNEYLQWFFIGGWLGIFLYAIALSRQLVVGFFNQDQIPFYGVLAGAIVSFFFFTWHILPTALIMVLYCGMIEGEKLEYKRVL